MSEETWNEETILRFERLFEDLGRECDRIAVACARYIETKADRDFVLAFDQAKALAAMLSGTQVSLVRSFAFEPAQAQRMLTTYVRIYVEAKGAKKSSPHGVALAAAVMSANDAEVVS